MTRAPLSETLLQLVEAVSAAPPGSGISVTDVDLEVPLEASVAVENGELVVRAGVPHTRWVSGVLPPVHLSQLRIIAMSNG